MNTIRRAHAWIITRTGGTDKSERGGVLDEGIVQAGLAVLGAVVVAVIVAKATGFMGKIESLVP